MNASVAAFLRAFDDGRARSEFYRSWRMGVTTGLAHPTSLGNITVTGGTTGALRGRLLEGTRAGTNLATLVRRHAQLLEPFERALLTMGEETGTLDAVLGALADFHFRQYRLILKVKAKLSYPLFVSLFAVVALPLPLIFLGRAGLYATTVLVGLVGWFAMAGAIFARMAQRYQQRPEYVRARFARTLATCLQAGLPLGRSVLLAAESSGHAPLVQYVQRQGERTLTSQPLSTTLAGAPTLTPEFHGTLRVTEHAGDYAPLTRLAELYEDGFK